MALDQKNKQFQFALTLLNTTDQHIFINGKAGSGKTTFLKSLDDHTYKNIIIAGSTGIAAINAGGVTVHSLFNLPLEPFVPENMEIFERRKLDGRSKLAIQNMEVLVIDEVSMLRADTLDAVDMILRKVRKRSDLLFGGVQMVFIGDLYQLPPVVLTQDRPLLLRHYASNFFIDSLAYKAANTVVVKLERVYRQKDFAFVEALNALRGDQFQAADLELLNSRVFADQAAHPLYAIMLTTHNEKADQLNAEKIRLLDGEASVFTARVTGNFAPDDYPTDAKLVLKVGAQVMMTKNDRSKDKRYFNGKIGVIDKIGETTLSVRFENGEYVELQEEIWLNTSYTFDHALNTLKQETAGSFQQFPVKPAWAITVHKSQGLTFDNAVVDVRNAFAAGHVYVALSRLTSLDGLFLTSPLNADLIKVDANVRDYMASDPPEIDETTLMKFQNRFLIGLLRKQFDWSYLQADPQILPPGSPDIEALKVHAEKFDKELSRYFAASGPDLEKFRERIHKGAEYFINQIAAFKGVIESFISPKKNDLNYVRQISALKELQRSLRFKEDQCKYAKLVVTELANGSKLETILKQASGKGYNIPKKTKSKTIAAELVVEEDILSMFRSGLSLDDIAEHKKLNPDTILKQLSVYLPTGEIDVLDLISAEALEELKLYFDEGTRSLLDLRIRSGDRYSFGQIISATTYFQLPK